MQTIEHRQFMLVPAILVILLATLSGRGMATGANGPVSRNRSLETTVADHLIAQGLGRESRIIILAVENRVFLLGVVPDMNRRIRAAQAARQVRGVRRVENFLITRTDELQKDDARLEQDIQSGLDRLRGVAPGDLTVRANGGTVFLRGRVEGWWNVAQAIQTAFIAGADYVVNELSIGIRERDTESRASSGSQTQSRTQQRTRRADAGLYNLPYEPEPDYSFGGPDDEFGPDYGDFENLGQVSPWEYDYDRYNRPENQYEHRWVQSAQDRRLQQRIASQLQDTIPDGRDLRVLVQNGQAFLYGRVRNQQERQRAGEITQNTPGIERVRNQLTVAARGWRRRDDSQIQEAIRDELRWSPFVDASQIEVDVNQGIATLSGMVDSFGGLIVAVESAFEGGARTVHDQLQIVRPDGRFGTDGATDRPFNMGMGRSR